MLKTTYLDEGPRGWTAGSGDVTRRDEGTIDPRKLIHLPGKRGEERLFLARASGRYESDQWDEFVDDIKEHGVQHRVMIEVLKDGKAVIMEGSHRLRAAVRAKKRTVPVEINYYGNSQRIVELFPVNGKARRRG